MARPIVVFSHLRWDFVYQRPQHLLSRLSANHRVLYVEEPIDGAQEADELILTETGGVTVVRPRLSTLGARTRANTVAAVSRLLGTLADAEEIANPIAWVYTPMAEPLLDAVDPALVVYDCMDELSLFAGAPAEMVRFEERLLQRADLVFTGGVSLYEAKRGRHPHVYCFPSSVDADHFAQAKLLASAAAAGAQLDGAPRHRLGFVGVLDERLDLEVLDALGATHPEWEIEMVGPTVKIDPATLPRRPNIHYRGQRPYEELPQFLATWDVCLLPFALNDATRFISPTKTLEYMAAERPIVSTPIADVASAYADIVYLANGADAFVGACERALAAPPDERARRVAAGRAVLARTSWDSTVSRMADLIDEALESRTFATGAGEPGRKAVLPQRVSALVVGAGPTGLSAAYHLGKDALLVEQQSTVGGWCRSFVDRGFTFDWAGHIMFSNDPYVHELYRLLLGDNVHWQDREAWIFSHGVYTRYPFQGALYGLPPAVIKECLVGAIEARFGTSLSQSGGTRPGSSKAQPRNFLEFIHKVWGRGIARHFAIPYNEKLWAMPLEEMETSWLGGRVPLPDLEDMIEGALSPVPKPMGPNARFGYPLRGGFQALMEGFLPHLTGELRLNTQAVRVSPSRRTATFADGSSARYEHLISTMPLTRLIALCGDEAPAPVRHAARALRHLSVRCVNIGVGRPDLTEKHWIYYPEETVFHRIFVQGNASPHCNPPGGFGFTCEITYSPSKPLPCEGEALIRRCIDDAIAVGFIRADDPIWAANEVDLPVAYVVYDHGRAANVELIREWLAKYGILLAGRYSEWEYYNSDHAFIAGLKAARQVRGETEVPAQAPAAGRAALQSVGRARAG
jgi:UDP-galactopyranose mutase